jgi:L-lactate dehydrogenase (cytochrome)/(S)-mandelate dehydrogenase
MAWNYIDGGADDLVTLQRNNESFRDWRLRQRSLVGVKSPKLTTTMARTAVSMPIALAPTGAAGLSHWTADIAAGHAAERAGTRLVLSTASSYTLEEVAEATEQNHWFQLYPFGNRSKVASLMERARLAGYTAMFVTVDVPVLGNREGERIAGMTHPWTLTPSRVLNMLSRPVWMYRVLRHRRIAAIHYLERDAEFAKSAGVVQSIRRKVQGAADDALASAETQARYMQGDMRWEDLAWMRELWRGPLYIKGVLDPDDAAHAVDKIGVEGVVVSNHGGRQLDRTLSSLDALPAIVDRIGNRAEVYLDGGVRRGTDVITALCLGARGVFIGRPYLYGLAGGGEAGVSSVLEIFRNELQRALVLMGCSDVNSLDCSWLARPGLASGPKCSPRSAEPCRVG